MENQENSSLSMFIELQEEPIPDTEPGASMLRKLAKKTGHLGETWALSDKMASTPRRRPFPEPSAELSTLAEIAPGSTRPHIALVCANVYPQFDFCTPPVGGGMETRAALFGRLLAATESWHLSFVVSDFGQPFVTQYEGIHFHIYQPVYRRAGRNVFPRLRKRRWFPVLNLDPRDFHLFWQIPLIAAWLALPALFFPRFWRRLRPNVVCCFGNNSQSAEVIADCRRTGIPTVLCIASDKDLSPDYRPRNREPNHYGMPKWKGYYALRNADCVVVQSDAQLKALWEHFGRDGVLIRNPVHVSPEDPRRWFSRMQREFVLWIGRSDEFVKRPLLFLDLARSCPQLPFLMIVSRTDDNAFLALKAACPENLRILEHVPPAEIWDYLSRARVFVNTSKFEGFPNTFLQCAVMGTPIVSMEVDPDGFLAKHGCGVLAEGSVTALRQAVLKLWSDDRQADALAIACHNYVLKHHEANGRVREFEACLSDVLATPKPPRPTWWTRLKRFA